MNPRDMGILNREAILKAIGKAGKGGASAEDLVDGIGLSLRSVQGHLRALKASNQIGRSAWRYYLPQHLPKD